MATSITLKVLTEGGVALEDQAVSVQAHGELGYLGILRHHAPLVTTLQPGTLTWRRPTGETQTRRIGSGLLEIINNQLTVLTDRVVDPGAAADAT